jgi:hypothetical protein
MQRKILTTKTLKEAMRGIEVRIRWYESRTRIKTPDGLYDAWCEVRDELASRGVSVPSGNSPPERR